MAEGVRLSVPFVLCFQLDKNWAHPLPFCYVEGFNKNGYVHWGMDTETLGGKKPATGSFKDARDYFLSQNTPQTLAYVFR